MFVNIVGFIHSQTSNESHLSDKHNGSSEGWLSHAVLDVFPEEPLPQGSALWLRSDVTVTPHVSAISFHMPVSVCV